ncbi:GTPase [Catenuloplanes sp. NPDC051500]|uniref:GTPase n=1 Tax=Catenuloplanes sp. NPDC051500 TaxID=3363959 RepID=UPI0037A43537
MTDMARDAFIDDVRRYRCRRRKPTFIISGGTGLGKTTTINTLFGRQVGAVGHLARGTDRPQYYKWGTRGRHIVLVDMPGFGDSKDRDQTSTSSYRRWLRGADAFIVVVTPPRPASLPTLRAVKALLKHGVRPERIVFGLNRLTLINVETDHDLVPLEIGQDGPAKPEFRAAADRAAAEFVSSLRDATGALFGGHQVVPYDAVTGWNVHPLLGRALRTLR